MDQTLLTKIKQDLEKSGFGSEMRAARTLLDRGWLVDAGFTFFDRDKSLSRELDLRAYCTRRALVDNKPAVNCYVYFAAEVKKTDKAWIAFRYPHKDELFSGGAWGQLVGASGLPSPAFDFARPLDQVSPTARLGWRAYGFHEAFKPPDKQSRWWATAVTAVKGAEDIVKGQKMEISPAERRRSDDLRKDPCHVHLVKPLVVLDGPLFSAAIDDHGEIELTEITSAPLVFRFRTANYDARHAYYVDVVTLATFPEYVAGVENGTESLLGRIAKKGKLEDVEWCLDRTLIEY